MTGEVNWSSEELSVFALRMPPDLFVVLPFFFTDSPGRFSGSSERL